jgi:hypothetical protein
MYDTTSRWSVTAAGTDSGATATQAAGGANTQHFVTTISGHTDADSIITIKDGTTIVWQTKVDVSVEGISFSFNGFCIPISPNATANGVIATSSSDCQVNIDGYTRP